MQTFFILFGYMDIEYEGWVKDLGLPPTGRLDTFLHITTGTSVLLGIAVCVLFVSKLYAGHYP